MCSAPRRVSSWRRSRRPSWPPAATSPMSAPSGGPRALPTPSPPSSRLAPDRGGPMAHAPPEAAAASRHLGAEPTGGTACDVLGQITVALHVGEHAQDRHVLAALVGRRLAMDELVLDGRRDLPDHLV